MSEDNQNLRSSALMDLLKGAVKTKWPQPNEQKEIENINTVNSNKQIMSDSVTELNKKEYKRIVREKRREFIHKHFGKPLAPLFEKLKNDAENRRPCHREVEFSVPEHFDVDKTENNLKEYFKDLGFNPIPEPRKGNDNTIIVLTLT